mgnify:CR=1 FL=1
MNGFLPISKQDMTDRGWYYCDFLIVTGDAYVDHPSFGTAIISRVLEDAGYKVAILSQPDFRDEHDFLEMGRPRYAVLINGGNIDSMVAHYTSAKKRRSDDAYTPGGVGGKRPDRAVTVYSMLARRAFPETPVYLGGIEASLRRFAHYDYWADRVMPSILESTGADGVMIGRGSLGDPWLFERANALLETGICPALPPFAERIDTAVRQIELAAEQKGEHIAMLEARRHVNCYLKRESGVKTFKNRICALTKLSDLYEIADELKAFVSAKENI